jgi:LmbE family N-acetylglucosaminyl deacetylase
MRPTSNDLSGFWTSRLPSGNEQTVKIPRRLSKLVRKLPTRFTGRGRYRFLVRDWSAISDLELAARVLGIESFSEQLAPVALPVEDMGKILVIAPHQDDETIGAGGLLLKAASAGASISIVFVTDGVQRGLAKRLGMDAASEQLAQLRDAEAKRVCELLGADMYQLGISNPDPRPTLSDLDRLIELIAQVGPDVILIPWILDAQVKHRLSNHLLWLADQRSRLPDCEVWGYQVHNTIYPNGYVDITDVIEEKRRLLAVFESQNLHMRRYDHFAMGMCAWNSRYLPEALSNGTERYAELFFAVPLREHLELIQSFYFRDLRSTYRGHERVIAGITPLHNAVVGG